MFYLNEWQEARYAIDCADCIVVSYFMQVAEKVQLLN